MIISVDEQLPSTHILRMMKIMMNPHASMLSRPQPQTQSQAAEDLEIRRSRSAILPTGPPGAPHLFHFISEKKTAYFAHSCASHAMSSWQKWSIQDRQCGSLQMKRLGFSDCRVSQVCSKFAGSQWIS